MQYTRRAIDDELDELIPGIAAISLDGPKGVGKTATATQRAVTTLHMDSPADAQLIRAAPEQLRTLAKPLLIDEWQRVPEVWDGVRRLVDENHDGGQFLLTGSAAPVGANIHSGAGRIVSLRMRPLSLDERGVETATVSLAELAGRSTSAIQGETRFGVTDYVTEIMASGFPGIRALSSRQRREQLDGYIARVIEKEFAEQGLRVRRPATLMAWLRAYAAATASTASYTTILDAATPGQPNKPAMATTTTYRDVLSQLWLLDEVPAWSPLSAPFTRLGSTAKHFLADPALAARLLQLRDDDLVDIARGAVIGPQEGTILGRLFEALIALSLQTYARASELSVSHLRTRNGDHEVDFIVHRGAACVGVEVKLGASVDDADVQHLLWLKQQLGEDLRDMVVINTGSRAYRRADGVAVIPAALLGP